MLIMSSAELGDAIFLAPAYFSLTHILTDWLSGCIFPNWPDINPEHRKQRQQK